MASVTYDYSDNDWIIQGAPETTIVTLKAGQGLVPAKTPLAFDATTGEYVVATETEKATRLTVYAIDTTTAQSAQVYKSGQFNRNLVNWHDTVDSELKQTIQFAGSEIAIGTPHQ